jgi:hypothetical protein
VKEIKFWRREHEFHSCDRLLECLVSKLCTPATTDTLYLKRIVARMHRPFMKAFYLLEKKCYISICGYKKGICPSKWHTDMHRLVIFVIMYTAILKTGNEGLACMLNEPAEKLKLVMTAIRDFEHKNKKTSKSTHWKGPIINPILPRHRELYLGELHSHATQALNKHRDHMVTEKESKNMDMINLLLERCFVEDFPLDIILLIEENWSEKYAVWTKLRQARASTSYRQWRSKIEQLPSKYHVYVKYILQKCKRHWQFSSRYSCHVKCTRHVMEEDRKLKYSVVTFCCYCWEFLTYVDMSKRPPSFGHYMNADTLHQRCHRCDSDNLRLVPCFNIVNSVNLEFGHPDRQGFKICVGQRDCFNLVGYPDGKCPNCSQRSTEYEKHENTCVCIGDGTYCEGCQMYMEMDPGITRRMGEAQIKLEREALKIRKHSEHAVREKSDFSEARRRQNMRYLFDRALYLKERTRLIK